MRTWNKAAISSAAVLCKWCPPPLFFKWSAFTLPCILATAISASSQSGINHRGENEWEICAVRSVPGMYLFLCCCLFFRIWSANTKTPKVKRRNRGTANYVRTLLGRRCCSWQINGKQMVEPLCKLNSCVCKISSALLAHGVDWEIIVVFFEIKIRSSPLWQRRPRHTAFHGGPSHFVSDM